MGKAIRAKRRRLAGWDYSTTGTYFVTFCTYGRAVLFGEIASGEMVLSPAGEACKTVLDDCPEVERFVVMPNHVHVLVSLHANDAISISTLVRILKSKMTMACHQAGIEGKIWQPSFHDHIVRNQLDYDRLYEYIENNPLRWELDCMYQPSNRSAGL